MKIVTFNIRYDCGQDGINNICYRKPLILQKIRQEAPDIVCFQEVLPHVAVWLKESLEEYYVVGCGRSETLEDEQTAIAYRKDVCNLIRLEVYWLSGTPYVPASRYPDQSICPRMCTEVVFQELATGKVFRVANTHLDHEGPEARKQGLRQILDRLEGEERYAGTPVVVTGDMNAWPGSETIAVLEEYPYENVTKDIGITFHGFGKTREPGCIDYIFTKGFVCESRERWTDEQEGVFLSDHFPVCAVLRAGYGRTTGSVIQ